MTETGVPGGLRITQYGPRAYDDHAPFRYPDYRSTVKRSPDHDMVRIIATLSESTGPGPIWSEMSTEDADLTTNAGTGGTAIGERIIVTGRVLDERGEPVPGTPAEARPDRVPGIGLSTGFIPVRPSPVWSRYWVSAHTR